VLVTSCLCYQMQFRSNLAIDCIVVININNNIYRLFYYLIFTVHYAMLMDSVGNAELFVYNCELELVFVFV